MGARAPINNVEDVFLGWHGFVIQQKGQELTAIVTEKRLKPEEIRQFVETELHSITNLRLIGLLERDC